MNYNIFIKIEKNIYQNKKLGKNNDIECFMIKCNIITRIKQFELYKCKKSLKHKISLQQNEGVQGKYCL